MLVLISFVSLSEHAVAQVRNAILAKLASCLVQAQYFLTVSLEFLRVGHTHEDVGIHSRVSVLHCLAHR